MRRIQKLIFLILCLMILPGGTLLYAASSKSDVAIYLNNVLQKQAGLWSEGVSYLSTEQLSENLFAMFSSEEGGKSIRIYKPNVNMVMIDDKGAIFGKVKSAGRITFSTLVQVDNLQTDISDIKLVITDPNDKSEIIDTQQIKDQKENFWFKSVEFTYTFNVEGSYAVRVYFKDADSKKWVPVSEIQIVTI